MLVEFTLLIEATLFSIAWIGMLMLQLITAYSQQIVDQKTGWNLQPINTNQYQLIGSHKMAVT